jgi:hypothetical protein
VTPKSVSSSLKMFFREGGNFLSFAGIENARPTGKSGFG